jgi:ABC-2 type transport system ATP-binding protein
MTDTPAIEAEGLVKTYGGRPVLKGLDLRIEPGEVFALLGQNGAGKTTTVRILSTLTCPDGGRARICGRDVVTDRHEVRRRISLTGQYVALDELLTGEENLRLIARLRRLGARESRARTVELLARFALEDAASRRVATYSGGMRRRLDLAASLLGRPEVVFLDEPTTGLDPRSRQGLWDIVRDLAADGTTIFLTTQHLEEADRLADRIAVLHDGVLAAEGTAAALKRQVAGGQDATLDDVFFALTEAIDV